MGIVKSGTRLAAVAAASALLLAACGGSSTSSESGAASAPASAAASGDAGGGEPQAGGTAYILTNAEQLLTLDPQVVYTGEDLAFLGATLTRTLTAYKMSPDNNEGTSLVPDMATDTGRVSNGGKTWEFTLKDGISWETGEAVTCADIAYGVSRTFDIGVTNGGPTYGIAYLDVPSAEDGSSAYKGPADGTGQELFDKAVTCSADGKTITFNLNKAVPDFNYAVTLHSFAAVPKAADTGAEYGNKIVSNGPYKISEYQKGKGGKLVLVRNENWDPASDDYRKAYPDSWQVDFGLDETVIDQRVIQSSGNDETALTQGLTTASLPLVFDDPAVASRAIDAFDPYTRYTAINVEKVPDKLVRQAIGVALDREALLKNAGGKYAGEFADGAVKPNIGVDYAATGLWDGLLGQAVPGTGDPEFAKKLLAQAGVKDLTITLDYAQSDDGDKAAAIYVESLKKAGITVKPNPIEPGQYYGVVFKDPNELLVGGWGPDWPNASTVIPPLFTVAGGWDLSRVDDKAFNDKVLAASTELDRAKQATMWQELNKEAAEQMWIIPTRFGRDQRLAGTKIGPVYSWPAYGSWPYADMYITQ
jgi:peptide/nickel transport system substrate-binding protein